MLLFGLFNFKFILAKNIWQAKSYLKSYQLHFGQPCYLACALKKYIILLFAKKLLNKSFTVCYPTQRHYVFGQLNPLLDVLLTNWKTEVREDLFGIWEDNAATKKELSTTKNK